MREVLVKVDGRGTGRRPIDVGRAPASLSRQE
jgi:hypothetical protein